MTDLTTSEPDLPPGVVAWANERPPAIRARVLAYPPTQLYRIKTTGQTAQIKSYDENKDATCDTCTVVAWQDWSPELTARRVFGVHFTDLSPLPPEGT